MIESTWQKYYGGVLREKIGGDFD